MDESFDADARAATLSFLYDRIDYERTASIPTAWQGLHLERTRKLLSRLGNPHQQIKLVHVAGTKGKGSTATMIASVLVEAGFRVGLYTSPHLRRLEERFVIDRQRCTSAQLVELVDHVRPAVSRLDAERLASDNRLTFFEITTAMALAHFRRQAVDIAVIEVGMGGRLDSTNVCHPLVSVITSISLDHTRQLGDTLAAIAAEKAGIIKPGIPVVSGVVSAEPRQVIERVAASQGSPLDALDRDFHFDFTPPVIDDATSSPRGRVRYWETSSKASPNVPIQHPAAEHAAAGHAATEHAATGHAATSRQRDPLRLQPGMLGRHQAANAAVATAAIGRLQSMGWKIPDRALVRGIAQASCPARIEVMATAPWIILDTAHNTASIAALVQVLNESFAARRRQLIFAATRDKDTAGMLRLLLPEFDEIVLTRYQDSPRAVPPEELHELVQEMDASDAGRGGGPRCVTSVAKDPLAAWRRCQSTLAADSLVCITGSFFLAAEMRDLLLTTARS